MDDAFLLVSVRPYLKHQAMVKKVAAMKGSQNSLEPKLITITALNMLEDCVDCEKIIGKVEVFNRGITLVAS